MELPHNDAIVILPLFLRHDIYVSCKPVLAFEISYDRSVSVPWGEACETHQQHLVS